MAIASSPLINHVLPVWAGISFAAIGVAYQLAATRKITPLRVFLIMAVCGSLLFAFKWTTAESPEFSIRAMLLGVATGISQYLAIILVGWAMRLGPFSPVWCMISLNFAPVVVYAQVIQGTRQPWTQWLAVAIAILCCILAAAGHGDNVSRPSSPRSKLLYGLLLAAVLVVNAILNISIHDLNSTGAGHLLDLFFLFMYASIAAITFLDAAKHGEVGTTFRRGWYPGLVASIGSVSGVISIGAASARSGPAAFLISSMVMLIVPMFAAILVFRERATLRWTATLVLGLLAIALANFS